MLRDRKHLSQDGLIIVVMAIDRDSGTLVSGPDLISRGFVYVRENEDIIENSRELARSIIASYGRIDGSEWQNMKNRIKDELHRYIFDQIKRNPMILPNKKFKKGLQHFKQRSDNTFFFIVFQIFRQTKHISTPL